MTDLEQRFVEEYTVDCKGAKAAVRAGYEKSRAKQTAWELKQNPAIKAAIEERLKLLAITADEATKNISDIASTRINEFMIVKKVLRTPTVKKSLSVLITELEAEIEFEDEFAREAQLDKSDLKRHVSSQKDRRQNLIRYRMELKRNPKAYRNVDGEPEWVERAELDLVAIARAKDVGNVFELSYTEFGPKIKMYDALKSNELILKLNGKLVERQDHTTKGESINKGFYDFLKKVNKTQ